MLYFDPLQKARQRRERQRVEDAVAKHYNRPARRFDRVLLPLGCEDVAEFILAEPVECTTRIISMDKRQQIETAELLG